MKWIRIPYERLQILALRANQLRPVPVEPFLGKQRSRPRSTWIVAVLTLPALLLCAGIILRVRGQDASNDAAYYAKNPAEMLSGYRHVEVASVSDAEEQLYGQRMYMSHRMQSLFPAKFAGYALTVRLAKQENHDPEALNGMLEAIDSGEADSVYVMSIEDGENIAALQGEGPALLQRRCGGNEKGSKRRRRIVSDDNRLQFCAPCAHPIRSPVRQATTCRPWPAARRRRRASVRAPRRAR